jgi:hypothetical protein
MFSGSTLCAASQSVALLQASHELRIGDGEHAVLPLSGDKLVADFIAIPGSALRNQFGFSGILRDPCRLRPDRRHSLPALARGGSPQQKPGGADECTEGEKLMVPAEIAAQIARLRSPTSDGALPSLRWKVE